MLWQYLSKQNSNVPCFLFRKSTSMNLLYQNAHKNTQQLMYKDGYRWIIYGSKYGKKQGLSMGRGLINHGRVFIYTMAVISFPQEWSKNLYKLTCKLVHNKYSEGLPGGAVVENLPANAGNTGSSPGLGRSHMPRSNWAREPQLLSLRVWSLCSATREAAIVRGPCTAMKSGPRLPQLEKALAQKRRPNTAINQSINQ